VTAQVIRIDPDMSRQSFLEKAAISLAWQQAKDVTALARIAGEFEAAQQKIMAEFDATKVTPAALQRECEAISRL